MKKREREREKRKRQKKTMKTILSFETVRYIVQSASLELSCNENRFICNGYEVERGCGGKKKIRRLTICMKTWNWRKCRTQILLGQINRWAHYKMDFQSALDGLLCPTRTKQVRSIVQMRQQYFVPAVILFSIYLSSVRHTFDVICKCSDTRDPFYGFW